MGLLDDAIREHLELKRRRGADPSEVARQQREALAPIGGAGEPTPEGEVEVAGEPEAAGEPPMEELAEPISAQAVATDEHPTEAHEQLAPPAGQATAQSVGETAEIDMETMLEDDVARLSTHTSGEAGGQAVPQPAMDQDDEINWDTSPPRRTEDEFDEHSEPPREIPGQERMSFE